MILGKLNKQNDNYKKVEINYDEKSSSHYSFKLYSRHPFLKNYFSKEGFHNLIDRANIIIYDAKMKKAKFDKVEVNIFVYLLFILILIMTIIYIILFYYAPRVEKKSSKLKTCGLVFFCFIIIILFSLEVFNSLRKIEGDKTLFDFYKTDMINYIDKLNDKYKNRIIFNFDESNKNIICYIKNDINNLDNSSKRWSNSSEIDSDIDNSSEKTKRSYIGSGSDLYSKKE